MEKRRFGRLGLWALLILPLINIGWSLLIIVRVTGQQEQISHHVGLIRRMIQLESKIAGFEKSVPIDDLSVGFEPSSPEWERLFNDYRAAFRDFDRTDPSVRPIEGYLARTDELVSELSSRRMNIAPADRDGAEIVGTTAGFFNTVNRAKDHVNGAVASIRTKLTASSIYLWSIWGQLYTLVVISSLLHAALVVMLLLHRREQTARKAAEKELKDNERLFRTLATQSPVGIFKTDPRGDCIYVNERWREMAGLTFEEAMGQGWTSALHPEDREHVIRQWYGAAETGSEYTGECRFRTPKGVVSWLSANAVVLKDDAGEITGFLGTVANITERKRLEEEARRHQEKLASIARLRIMGEMASGLAHELKQPLCAMTTYIQACKRMMPAKSDEASEALTTTMNKVEDQALRAGQIIDRIRDFVRGCVRRGFIPVSVDEPSD